jgi:zinc/manganese transport system substrate-binding protein
MRCRLVSAGMVQRLLPLLVALGLAAFAACSKPGAVSGRIPVVAAENFYGDIARQIGGGRVTVTSILSDPNVDPHEYESSVRAAKSIYHAKLVIENGGGYDAWMDRLLSASSDPSRMVINAYAIAVTKLPDNDHVWYDSSNMLAVARAVRDDLTKLDASAGPSYDSNCKALEQSFAAIGSKMAEIKSRFGGTPIALTETVFQYQAVALDLKVLTPFAFQKAIAEGTDPPANAAVAAEDQMVRKQVKTLVYNRQTVNRLTTKLLNEAKAAGIPVVGVTETMPLGMDYQSWMLGQLSRLEEALGGKQ